MFFIKLNIRKKEAARKLFNVFSIYKYNNTYRVMKDSSY